MKIGITYLYTIMKYGYPPKPADDLKAIAEMGKLGFHYLEMEGLGREHAETVLKNKTEYKSVLSDTGIHVHNFCVVEPDLVSLDKTKRSMAYDNFKRISEVGIYLGTETLHLASYAPPVNYCGKAPYKLDGGDYSFGDRFSLTIPDGFSWPRVWENLVESCRFCAEVAKGYGKTVIMEPRVGEIICSVDSMIRLINDVDMDNFKANFDTGHFSAQRENVNLALMKLEGMFENIHVSDNNPENVEHLAVGDGIIDWYEFFKILKNMNYDGYLGVDLGGGPKLEDNLIRSREYIIKVAASIGCDVAW